VARSLGEEGTSLIFKQTLTDSVAEAAAAKFVGYPTRFLQNERQYAISDTGDLADFLSDLRQHRQGITDSLGLLECYAELKSGSGPPTVEPEQVTALLPTKIEPQEGREWTTKDFNTANFIFYRGNPLLRSYVEDGRTRFVFSWDEGLTAAVAAFNQKRITVSPHLWALAGFRVRDAMRAANGF